MNTIANILSSNKQVKRIPIIIILLWIVIFICISCHNRKDNSGKTVFRYNESQGIPTLDPAFARNQVIIWPVAQLFNGLVQLNDTLGIDPCIASSWIISEDGLEYTFFLRNDVWFHEHESFGAERTRKATAYDFEYSFKRIFDPETASPGTWIFANADFSKGGFVAVNDTTFTIYLKQPFPAFLGLLAMQYCSVIPHEAVEFMKSDFGNFPVGTGPFKIKYWKEGEKLILVKNDAYFETDSEGRKLPYLDAVSITFIRDKQSEFLQFMKHEIDFLNHIHKSYKNELLTPLGQLNPKYQGKIRMDKDQYLNTEYLAFFMGQNEFISSDNPLSYEELRKAINYGFDRKKMIKYLRNNIGEPALSGFIPQGLPGYFPGWGYHYNPDSARVLIKRLENKIGEIPVITLTTTSDYADLCEFIQHELANFGVKIEIEVSVGATFRSSVANSKLPFFRASWLADYPDAENYLSLFYSKNFSPYGPNYTHFYNSEYDFLYESSLRETNTDIRTGLYHQMDRIIMNNAVIVPLYYDQVVRFTHKDVKGLTTNPVNLLVLKRVYKEKGL